MLAPPFEFIARNFVSIVSRMGPTVTVRLVRPGFYPRGAGRIEVDIVPAPLRPIDCRERGALVERPALAMFAAIPPGVVDREIAIAKKLLHDSPEEAFAVRELPENQGQGNILLLEAAFEHVTEVVSGSGKLGVSVERVARAAVGRMAGYLASSAFAGPYLANQLMLPFALAGGGRFTTVKPSGHSVTAAAIIERFLYRTCTIVQEPSGMHLVEVR